MSVSSKFFSVHFQSSKDEKKNLQISYMQYYFSFWSVWNYRTLFRSNLCRALLYKGILYSNEIFQIAEQIPTQAKFSLSVSSMLV